MFQSCPGLYNGKMQVRENAPGLCCPCVSAQHSQLIRGRALLAKVELAMTLGERGKEWMAITMWVVPGKLNLQTLDILE
jgi:hypothetical protein